MGAFSLEFFDVFDIITNLFGTVRGIIKLRIWSGTSVKHKQMMI